MHDQSFGQWASFPPPVAIETEWSHLIRTQVAQAHCSEKFSFQLSYMYYRGLRCGFTKICTIIRYQASPTILQSLPNQTSSIENHIKVVGQFDQPATSQPQFTNQRADVAKLTSSKRGQRGQRTRNKTQLLAICSLTSPIKNYFSLHKRLTNQPVRISLFWSFLTVGNFPKQFGQPIRQLWCSFAIFLGNQTLVNFL